MRRGEALLLGTLVLPGCGGEPPPGSAAAPADPAAADQPEPARLEPVEPVAAPAWWRRGRPTERARAPLNLASLIIPAQGGGEAWLSFKSLHVEVDVVGRTARTQVTQVFHNHTGRRTEGTYEMTLPDGAAISRLAMDVEGRLMEGELVERERARQIYESIVRKRKDPALLEWQGGNRFKTQVFPIEPHSDKTVVLAYEQLLPATGGELRYAYGLPVLEGDGGQPLGRFEFSLRAAGVRAEAVEPYAAVSGKGGHSLTLRQERFRPAGPLEVRLHRDQPAEPAIRYASRKGEHFFLVDHTADPVAGRDRPGRDLVVALDTSAGIGSVELERAKTLVLELVRRLPRDRRVSVVLGDLRIRLCHDEPLPASEAERIAACLAGVDAGGATDLGGLLRRAGEVAAGRRRPVSIVALTDGVASVGELDGDLVAASVLDSIEGRPVALHTVAVGHAPNVDYLRTLSRRGRGHAVRLHPGADPVAAGQSLSAVIRTALVTDVEVSVEAGEVAGLVPAAPVNLVPGEALAIMGRLVSPQATLRLRGRAGGRGITHRFEVARPRAAADPLLVSFWARSRIDVLQQGHVDRAKVVQTSLKYGVMSRYTSFLVLENEEAYKRFNVERRKEAERQERQTAAVENLAKGKGSLQEALQRREEAPEAEAKAEKPGHKAKKPVREPDAFAGATGVASAAAPRDGHRSRRGGGTAGEAVDIGDLRSARAERSRRSGGREVRVRTRCTAGRVTGTGKLDKAQIVSVVERRQPAVHSCFEREHRRTPSLAGKVGVRFTIGTMGRVIRIETTTNSTGSEAVGSCILARLRRWRFPKPEGGELTVHYTFLFSSGCPAGSQNPVRCIEVLEARSELDGLQRDTLLRLYLKTGRPDRAKDRLRRWRKAMAPGDLYDLLRGFFGNDTFVEERLDLLRALLAEEPDPWTLEEYVHLGLEAGQTRDVADRVGRYCRSEDADVEACAEWIGRLGSGRRAARLKGEMVRRWRKRLDPDELYDALTELDDGAFVKERLALLRGQLDEEADEELLEEYIELGIEAGLTRDVAVRLERHCKAPDADVAGCAEWLHRLGSGRQATRLKAELLRAWRKRLPPFDLYRTLISELDESAFVEERLDLLREVLTHDPRDRLVRDYLQLGLRAGRKKEVGDWVAGLCESDSAVVRSCVGWLALLGADARAGPRLVERIDARLEQVRRLRREDVADPDLISELAELLLARGREAQALRRLSEMVEFTPHDFSARTRYAERLAALARIEEACGQYAAAVQVDPARRDTFRTIMAMRRRHGEQARAVRRCIVDGVSKLPVQRAVSLVLTWEDDSADVDLHVHEQGGEEVFYSHRESAIGGLLYYDITDGYGPEIYVLGSGPKGPYRMTLVYFRGDAAQVRGTLTILRAAGSPEESREDRPFSLKRTGRGRQIPVGTFTL